ncbi:hypothetical protein D9613_009774 [Agrocybe pediades]|uniref:Uncharacterized protein n=1 Tax=Agrocybe pediades TaxID=84607 RepID=A0A8H4VSW7_9AGAR|nr:hypothetical protein D9613_009774 [Agrocybe pediades]
MTIAFSTPFPDRALQHCKALAVFRQQGKDPSTFCSPLKGRRDHAADEEEDNLTFDAALQELRNIARSGSEQMKQVANITPNDDKPKWKQSTQLDTLPQFLQNKPISRNRL